jgi:DNA-binding transcriptional LysR family regulator
MYSDQWLGLELRHLSALAAIAGEGSFRGAAERLGYVQSAVSQQLSVLERLVGARLVERSRGARPVSITPAGELLLHHADDILARAAAAKADLDRLHAGVTGSVRIGGFPAVVRRVLPSVLAKFGERYPDVAVTVGEWATDAPLFEQVADGRLDIAFAHLPLEPGPFADCELLSAAPVLLVAADSPLARREEPPTLTEIARMPLIAGQTSRVRAGLEHQLRRARGALDVVFRSDVDETIASMVAAGRGVALATRLTAADVDERIAIVDLDDRFEPVGVALFWHRERLLLPAVQELAAVAREVCTGRSYKRAGSNRRESLKRPSTW